MWSSFIEMVDRYYLKRRRCVKEIGRGQCGTVYTEAAIHEVFKVNNPGKLDQLWNDCCMHKQVEEAFQQTTFELRENINLPRILAWHTPSSGSTLPAWRETFPEAAQPEYGLVSSRIDPIPDKMVYTLVVRLGLYDKIPGGLSNMRTQYCLLRLYLGRRGERHATRSISLRNFDLLVNEMETMEFDTMKFAQTIAKALALLHWQANVDGNDVEFVLGRTPRFAMAPTAADLRATDTNSAGVLFGPSLGQDGVAVWLLDFDQCQTFPHDEAGLQQLVRSFFFNDPYYPRPHAEDPKDVALWETLKNSYLQTSAALTQCQMPEPFIEAVEVEGAKRKAGGSIFQ